MEQKSNQDDVVWLTSGLREKMKVNYEEFIANFTHQQTKMSHDRRMRHSWTHKVLD